MGENNLLKIATVHSDCALFVSRLCVWRRTSCFHESCGQTSRIWLIKWTKQRVNQWSCQIISFFQLGRLYSKPASSKNRPTITDFIAAVSLADFSLWAIFDVWDGDWIEAEEGNEMNRIGEDRHETPLKIPAEKALTGPVIISNPHFTVEGDRKANTLKFSFTITTRLIIILHTAYNLRP